jgi:radical SAM protein with 4Fe4S-binding SPASM domain
MEINLLKHLTFRRIWNLVEIIAGYFLSRLTGKVIVIGVPFSLNIEPSGICNLSCPECPAGNGDMSRPAGLLNFKDFQLIADQIFRESFYLQLFFQGEPFINKDIFNIIDYARKKKIYTSVSTNAQLLTVRNIGLLMKNPPDKIILSIDGYDEESYSVYRKGGSYKSADEGFRNLVSAKKQHQSKYPFIEYQVLVMKQNEHHLEKIKKYALSNGADKVVFKTIQVYDNSGAEKFLPYNNSFSRYSDYKDKLVPKSKLLNKCFSLWSSSVITWDGSVVPCCFDKDAEYEFGNAIRNSFRDIWFSEKYNLFRKKILENRRGIHICNNCSEGLKVNLNISKS